MRDFEIKIDSRELDDALERFSARDLTAPRSVLGDEILDSTRLFATSDRRMATTVYPRVRGAPHSARCAVYPRVRGATHVSINSRAMSWGLSPRARGNQ